MKIVSMKESTAFVKTIIKEFPKAKRLPLYSVWKKAEKIVTFVFFIVSMYFAIHYFQMYRQDVMPFFNIINLNQYGRVILAIVGFTVIFLSGIFMAIVHELLHVPGYRLFHICSFIVLSKPIKFTVMAEDWVKKKRHLFILILPVTVIFLVSIFIGLQFKSMMLFVLLTLLNFSLSSYNIVIFITVLMKAPKNSFILGHYYRNT